MLGRKVPRGGVAEARATRSRPAAGLTPSTVGGRGRGRRRALTRRGSRSPAGLPLPISGRGSALDEKGLGSLSVCAVDEWE